MGPFIYMGMVLEGWLLVQPIYLWWKQHTFYSLHENIVYSSLQRHNNSRGNPCLFFPFKSPSNWWTKHEGITHITLWERKKYWQEVGYGALNQGSDWSGFQMPSHPSAQFYLLHKPKPENFAGLHKVDAITGNPKTMIEEKYWPYGATWIKSRESVSWERKRSKTERSMQMVGETLWNTILWGCGEIVVPSSTLK